LLTGQYAVGSVDESHSDVVPVARHVGKLADIIIVDDAIQEISYEAGHGKPVYLAVDLGNLLRRQCMGSLRL